MPQLLLIRHAKSSWDDPSLSDHQRPLNARGAQAGAVMGKRLRDQLSGTQRIFVSTATRTQQTLGTLLQQGQLANKCAISMHDALYHASATELIDFIRNEGQHYDHVTIIGHNPGLTDCVQQLCAGQGCDLPDNIVTAGAALLSCTQSWAALTNARLLWYRYPKQDIHQDEQ